MPSIDIDIDDIMYGLSRNEKQELVDELYEDGYCPKALEGTLKDDEIQYPTDFDLQVKKLIGNSWRLSKEDEETILRITNKIV